MAARTVAPLAVDPRLVAAHLAAVAAAVAEVDAALDSPLRRRDRLLAKDRPALL